MTNQLTDEQRISLDTKYGGSIMRMYDAIDEEVRQMIEQRAKEVSPEMRDYLEAKKKGSSTGVSSDMKDYLENRKNQ